MADTYSFISGSVLGTSASSYTFSNIPANYTDLKIIASVRNNSNSDAFSVQVNGADYLTYYHDLKEYDGASFAAGYYAGTTAQLYGAAAFGGVQAANHFSQVEITIANYSASINKPLSYMGGNKNNIVNSQSQSFGGGNILVTAPITSITLAPFGGNSFVATSSFMLYGIKNS